MQDETLKVFIVDDDPTSRMIANYAFDEQCYRVSEFSSGEALLAAIEQQPDIILLDVEMPGKSGVECCHELRASGEENAYIIFISSHDDLDTRLRAYDAGGQDYLVKPYISEELLQKVRGGHQQITKQFGLLQQSKFAQQAAFSAMSSMGELGVVLRFLRASFGCQNLMQLADELRTALEQYGLLGIIELRSQAGSLCVSTQGECSPLEVSMLKHARDLERIFQFGSRLVINYPGVTLVMPDLPKDPDLVGRLRDHLATLAEGADARIVSLDSEATRLTQSMSIIEAVREMSTALETIDSQQAGHRLRGLAIMDAFVFELESSFVHLGLTQGQEDTLTELARRTAENIGTLLGEGKAVSDQFRTITQKLQHMARPD